MGTGHRARARVRAGAPDRGRAAGRTSMAPPRAGLRRRGRACSREHETSRRCAGCAATSASRRSTCRSSSSSAARPEREVDDHDRGRAPARDHARHVDRLRAPDDARVLLRGVHAVASTTRASRRASRSPRPGEDPREASVRGFLEQTRNILVGVEGRDRAGADRRPLDGARGRPPRARAGARDDERRARVAVRDRDHRRGGARAPLLRARRSTRTACAPWRSTSARCRRSGRSRSCCVSRARSWASR